MKLEELLDRRNIDFEKLHHRPVYTANRMAQELHVPGREVAKTVLLRTEQGYVAAVIPANRRIDLERACGCLGEEWVEMASESEIHQIYDDCETGARLPFGSLYHLRTLVDETLEEDEDIVFEGATHEEAIKMHYRDFENLEHPLKGRFTFPG